MCNKSFLHIFLVLSLMAATLACSMTPSRPPVVNPASAKSQEPARAGEPVLNGDFSLVVDSQVDARGENLYLSLSIKNVGNSSRLLRYTCASIRLRDDLGTAYAPLYSGDDNKELYATRQVSLLPGESVTLESAENWQWGFDRSIPPFVGPVSVQARKLIVEIDGLGPFDNVQVEINL